MDGLLEAYPGITIHAYRVTEGMATLELLLTKIPIKTEKQALKILDICSKKQFINAEEEVCEVQANKSFTEERYDVLDSDGFEKMVCVKGDQYINVMSQTEGHTVQLIAGNHLSCDTCILKRDHHCVFTGCCVGHRNQRYFLRFIVHIILGTFYALCYNSAYFWWLHKETFLDLGTAVKMICPFMTFLAEFSWTNIYLVIYEINVIALIYTGVLSFFQGSNILKGAVSYHERQTAKYDMGWRKNLIIVMGNRWRLVWLWAFLDSKLPHDGV
ncbi:probable palmitoyltransferase ZDHHC24 [Glossina fuscipes]|uniref:Multifunctional fusion protein n=1 Tax=Glossina fuscipes TaxID=7396 RepID=A0A9C5ZC69_9MUSC|nr:probable palmitoyltransferase ZDHHC24 [Glossina fuscipes]